MNILVPHSWLKDYLHTAVPAKMIGSAMSLSGPSVERTLKKGDDWVYDIEITTNRPDTASVLGIAREAATILRYAGHKAAFVPPQIKKPTFPTRSLPLKVTIQPASLCPRFTAVVLDNVTIKPSPKRICDRLEASGLRALNNIVDLSNYLMLETGQPIHTFDYDRIGRHQMKVRLSRKKEVVTTLDGIQRSLPGGDIVIEDGEGRLIDLCGIMGGQNSAITDKTKRVVFFVQSYDPVLIRRTSMLLAHRTEAAIRFERGVDEEEIPSVVRRGIKLAGDTAGAKLASGLTDIYPQKKASVTITTTAAFIQDRLGVKLSAQKMQLILSSLGFTVKRSGDSISATVPSWRKSDVSQAEDLVEEIARIYGYHNLPSRLPPLSQAPTLRFQSLAMEGKIKHLLKSWGFTEIYNYSMISDELIQLAGTPEHECVRLANPMSQEWVWLRPSLIPSLLANVAHNQSRYSQMRLFEMANTYRKSGPGLPAEEMTLAGIILPGTFTQTKGVLLQLLSELQLPRPLVKEVTLGYLNPTQAASLQIDEKDIGWFGFLNANYRRTLDLPNYVFLFQLKLEGIKKSPRVTPSFTPLSPYPPVIEDLTFVIKPQTRFGDVLETIRSLDKAIVAVEPTIAFRNARTVRVTYQSFTGNLPAARVTKIRQKIIETLAEIHHLKLKE